MVSLDGTVTWVPGSHLGASRDQYGVTVLVRFLTVLGKDRTSPYLYGTVVRYGRNFSNTLSVYKPDNKSSDIASKLHSHSVQRTHEHTNTNVPLMYIMLPKLKVGSGIASHTLKSS